tara:strand:+ start:85 stop:279 length:195 start_codon:yes stop_codon:yes gene_type:complete
MAFRGNLKEEVKTPKRIDNTLELDQGEIEMILQLIKASNFSGDMIEKVYNVTYKLQVLHSKLNK